MKRNLFKKSTLAAAVAIAALGLGAAGTAQAAARAYASIQLTDFYVGYYLNDTGTTNATAGTDFTISATSLPRVTSGSATWNGSGPTTSDSVAYNAQSDAPQAVAGPGAFPGQNNWNYYALKTMPGAGARGDSLTTATVGGVVAAVYNASEAVVPDAYNSSAKAGSSNENTYTVSITVGDQDIWVDFNADAMFAFTAYADAGDTAQGSTTAEFTVKQGTATLYDYKPGELNNTCSSQNGAGKDCGTGQLAGGFDTFSMDSSATDGLAHLSAGQSYLLNLYISSAVSATNVPEPASMALLGLGLVGLAATRRRFVRV